MPHYRFKEINMCFHHRKQIIIFIYEQQQKKKQEEEKSNSGCPKRWIMHKTTIIFCMSSNIRCRLYVYIDACVDDGHFNHNSHTPEKIISKQHYSETIFNCSHAIVNIFQLATEYAQNCERLSLPLHRYHCRRCSSHKTYRKLNIINTCVEQQLSIIILLSIEQE